MKRRGFDSIEPPPGQWSTILPLQWMATAVLLLAGFALGALITLAMSAPASGVS